MLEPGRRLANAKHRLWQAYGLLGPGFQSWRLYRELGDGPVGAVRLALTADAGALAEEIQPGMGAARPRNQGAQRDVDSILLRTYGNQRLHHARSSFHDTPALARFPRVRSAIHDLIPARPCSALLASLRPKSVITMHSDRTRYFSSTIRVVLPIITNPEAAVMSGGLSYRMQAGEVWAFNNTALHAAVNDHPVRPRIHLICDFAHSAALIDLIAAGEPHLGRRDPAVLERVREESLRRARGA